MAVTDSRGHTSGIRDFLQNSRDASSGGWYPPLDRLDLGMALQAVGDQVAVEPTLGGSRRWIRSSSLVDAQYVSCVLDNGVEAGDGEGIEPDEAGLRL